MNDKKMKKILIVDDEEDLLFSIKYGLEYSSNEYEIKVANDGNKCINMLKEEIPDLILLDLMMPNMNGWQVLDMLLEDTVWRDIPTFIMTASKDPEFRRSAENLGIPYIQKPFTINELKHNLDNYFNNELE
jgi:CheY-like chemotaxis protein